MLGFLENDGARVCLFLGFVSSLQLRLDYCCHDDDPGPMMHIVPYLRAVVEDVLAAVTHVHVSGKMHEMVLGDIGRQGIDRNTQTLVWLFLAFFSASSVSHVLLALPC